MYEFKLPDLGEGIHEGEVLKWHVHEGDNIAEDEPLIEVETDKAAVTIPSPRGGVIAKLYGGVGETVYTGHVIAVIAASAEEAASYAGDKSAGQSMATKNPQQSLDEAAAQTEHQIKENTVPSSGSAAKAVRHEGGPVPAAPATRRLAREMGVDINLVPGTGPAGRITPEDIQRYASGDSSEAQEKSKVAASASINGAEPADEQKALAQLSTGAIPLLELEPMPDFKQFGDIETEAFRSVRRKIAKRMVQAAAIIPHAAHLDELDTTALEAFRKEQKQYFKDAHGVNLTFMAFALKAISRLLQEFPSFNASLDLHNEQLVYKKYYNIGFAADTPKGLMVPVIRHADRMSIADLAKNLQALAHKAREGSLEPQELKGGTFTITNIGALGGTGMKPIINYPEAAIFAMGKAEERPVVRDSKIVIRTIMPLNLTFDHRIVDGADAARFVNRFKQMLASPEHLLLEV